MSKLTENPTLLLEVVAVLVRRLGGDVTIEEAETPGPFNLMSKMGGGQLRLILDETITHEEIDEQNALDAQSTTLIQ